jgi:hypothetical protein
VNLARSVIVGGATPAEGFVMGGPLEHGESSTVTVDVSAGEPGALANGSTPSLKVTLVWTDPAGDTLQNDLDLVVRTQGGERHGNMGTSSGFDRVNNVEQVVWNNIPAGTAEIIVSAFRVTNFPQPYALVWRLT